MTEEFVRWKYRACDDAIVPEQVSEAQPRPEQAEVPLETYAYTVDTYNIFTLTDNFTCQRRADSTSPAVDLMRHGFIVKSPTRPIIAVSVSTLELLYRLRQRKPSYSIEAFAKVVCDYYNKPYRRHIREVFADTFEVYLRITRNVHKQVYEVLGWGAPDWRVKNACRACCYELEDEPPLRFGRLIAMDGNNSLKRMATATHRTAADTRSLEDSDYFIPSSFVNRFANEVHGKISKGPTVKHNRLDSDDESAPNNDAREARRRKLALCVKNWKSAAKEERKKMWAIFDEAGIFAAACRHGFFLWVIDMVCSGELAKYPLAIVAKVLETSKQVLLGYDVGCSFDTTTERSSLGPAFAASGGRFCVCAFHGYSHCYACQLEYHPNIIPGAGLEDLETMERLFSLTNALASVTRYASPYRRRLFIEAFLRQIDENKHLNSGTFILNNYKQALEIIHHDAAAFNEALQSLGITEVDLDQWEADEAAFFSHLGQEDPHDVHAIAYVERLQDLRELESKRAQANTRFLSYLPTGGPAYNRDQSTTRRVETEHRHANERYDRVYADVCALELQMGIAVRWTPLTPEYLAAIKYIKERQYHRTLNKLQKLVTQRLFELQRMNVAQTGEKFFYQIQPSLQTRSKAIQQAIASYNTAAAALDPPHPPLNWSEIGGYQFLEQFALLQNTRNDVCDLQWTKSAVRAVMKMRHRIRHTREEIDRLNVEVRRLHTAIRDERVLFNQTCARLQAANDPLLGPVKEFAERRGRMNDHLLGRVYEVYRLQGFTGIKGTDVRVGLIPVVLDEAAGPVPDLDEANRDDDVDVLEGDEEQDTLGHLVDFISALDV
ncbi:hypothetical protein BDW22DRAFT_1329220 [Trametopsis cervina]|nr:hypothetical protein BDW22DRAFT_1329220 [Trametopsis cervina]